MYLFFEEGLQLVNVHWHLTVMQLVLMFWLLVLSTFSTSSGHTPSWRIARQKKLELNWTDWWYMAHHIINCYGLNVAKKKKSFFPIRCSCTFLLWGFGYPSPNDITCSSCRNVFSLVLEQATQEPKNINEFSHFFPDFPATYL